MTRHERKVFRELVFRVLLAIDYAKGRKQFTGPIADVEFMKAFEAAATLVEDAHSHYHPTPKEVNDEARDRTA